MEKCFNKQTFSYQNNFLFVLQGKKVFAWYDGTLSAADQYIGRVNLLDNSYGYGKASVNLTSIRESDSGWYECRVIFPNRTPSTRNNGTWYIIENLYLNLN